MSALERRDRIRSQVRAGQLRFTLHAHQEMSEEDISLAEVLEALASAEVVEDYPNHRRGPCCLALGLTRAQRPLHVVCTTEQPMPIVITVYEPAPPKWVTPRQRGGRPHEV